MTSALRASIVAGLAVVLAGVAYPGQAWACRLRVWPEATRQRADAVVVVELIEVETVGDQSRFITWRATGEARAVAFGEPGERRFVLSTAYASAGCGGGPPPVGDLWVFYLDLQEDSPRVTAHYRLAAAAALDSRVADLTLNN